MSVLNNKFRTVMCGELNGNNKGNSVILSGWVQKSRDLGSIIFVWLRDRSGLVQLVFDENICDKSVFEVGKKLRNEYVISINGTVEKRADEAINKNIKTGDIEVFVNSCTIINEAYTTPIYVDDNADESEAVRLKYRYIDLRKPKMQKALMFRYKLIKALRDYIDEEGFIEVETPILTKSTPEGARDYLVPSRVHPGEFYALPQSPQIYKQLLMVSGVDKYYQIARCFRDEDGRADRQPEFTQFDMEMSFVDAADIQRVVAGAFKKVFADLLNIDIPTPLPAITWKEAMYKYGSDKPDTRFGMEISIINDIVNNSGFTVFDSVVVDNGNVCAIKIDGGADISRKQIDKLTDYVKTYHVKGLAWIKCEEDGSIKSSFSKFVSEDLLQKIVTELNANEGDAIFIIADKEYVALTAMGQLRLNIAKERNLIDENKFNLFWVTEFPLLEWSEEDNRFVAMHHPFTSPMKDDEELMLTNPGKVRANSYDLVLNGIEMGSGSIRIHNSALQENMFKLLGIEKEEAWQKFGFLLEAFKYGTPPHGGFAFGIDRMVMAMLKVENLRDVLAFPKIQNGTCLLMDTPTQVKKEQLDVLHLELKDIE